MIVAANNHQGKARMLVAALKEGGHDIVDRDYTPAHALLIDLDIPVSHYEQTVEKQVIAGAKVVLYQHGAFPPLVWDGIYPASDRVSAYFVMNEGTKTVGEMYNLAHPQIVVGWYYCDRLPYSGTNEIKRILFAPWHPLQSGYVHPDRQRKNAQMFAEILKLQDEYEIAVRMIGTGLANGISEDVPGVEYIIAHPDTTCDDIDAADLIISPVGTFPLMALARGKPTVMFGQDLRPHDGDSDTRIKYVHTWPKYRDYMHYPYHWPDRSLAELIEMTTIAPDWYIQNFVGDPFDPGKFVSLFESIVEGEREYA